jgi:hypothetical protein
MAQTTTQDALCVHDAEPDSSPSQMDRANRARHEEMVVLPVTNADGICTGQYRVKTHGGFYTTNLSGKYCSCPDAEHNSALCKHRRRVAMMVNDDGSSLPAPKEPLSDSYVEELNDIIETLRLTVRLLRGSAEREDVSEDGQVSLNIRASELETLLGVAKTARKRLEG